MKSLRSNLILFCSSNINYILKMHRQKSLDQFVKSNKKKTQTEVQEQ